MTGRDRAPRLAVLVSGGGSNLQAIMDRIAAGTLAARIASVVSDRPGAYALERARAAGIPATCLDYATAGGREAFGQRLAALLEGLRPDLVVLAGFMRILPDALVERYRGRMLNVHPSLLPKYPGLHTYRRVLEAGDAWHGSTVHFVTPELDAGPAIIQYRIRVRSDDTEETLRERVQRGEHVIYPLAIGQVIEGRVVLRDGHVWRDGVPSQGPEVMDETAD